MNKHSSPPATQQAAKQLAYLAGPMRGYLEYNFPAFHAAAAKLRAHGLEVWSPAEHDLNEDGFDPAKDTAQPMRHYMRRDLPAVLGADMVCVLEGWEKSQGATLEVHVAQACGIPVYRADTLQSISAPSPTASSDVPYFSGEFRPLIDAMNEALMDTYASGRPAAHLEDAWENLQLALSRRLPSTVAVANKPLPHGCYCQLGKCAAPRIMGQQMPCRDERKAAGITPNKDDEREAQSLSSSIGGKDGRCPTCLNALTPGAHALLTQIQDDRAILALIEEVEALRRGVGVTHGDGNDPAMLLKRVVGTREDVDRREAIYREAVAHGKGGWWRCYTCAPATADDNL